MPCQWHMHRNVHARSPEGQEIILKGTQIKCQPIDLDYKIFVYNWKWTAYKSRSDFILTHFIQYPQPQYIILQPKGYL